MVLICVLANLVHRLVPMDLLSSTTNALSQLKMFYRKLFQQLNAIHFVYSVMQPPESVLLVEVDLF